MEFDIDPTDDVRAALEKMKSETSSPAPSGDAPSPDASPEKPPSPKDEASGGERARDESGRFAAKTEASPEAAKAEPAKAEAAKAEPAKVEAPVNDPGPPAHWKGAGKLAWAQLPPEVRASISADYAQVSQSRDRLSALESAIGPDRAQVLAANYGSVEQGLKNILAGSDFANKNPQGFILWLANRAGIDLTQLAGQGGGDGANPANAQPHPLVAEVTSLRNEIAQLRQSQTQAPVQSQIDAMAKDVARFPYFNDVRTQMAGLIQTGAATTLEAAYEQAVRAHPDTWKSVLEAERKKEADAAAAKVAAAKNAAVSITGTPRGARAPDDAPNETIEDTVRRHLSRIRAA